MRNLSGEPVLREVAPPALSASQHAELGAERRRIGAPPGWDGPHTMVAATEADTIFVYPATYAWRALHRDSSQPDGRSPLGWGTLACTVCLFRDDGRTLIARRSLDLQSEPGRWCAAVTGGVDPGESCAAAACRELAEELHLHPLDREAVPSPVALGLYGGDHGLHAVYALTLRRPEAVSLRGSEATALRWERPRHVGADVVHHRLIRAAARRR